MRIDIRRSVGRSPVTRRARALAPVMVAALTLAALTTAGPSAVAAEVSFNLCAVPGTLPLPGAATVPVWGFGIPSTPGDCTSASAGLPGPTLDVAAGDHVTLTITNALPDPQPLQFELPGLRLDPGDPTVAPGATHSISFTVDRPGTFLYESDGDAGRQSAMGLFGALLARPPAAGQAYSDPSTAYDEQQVLVLSAIDPAFNAAPQTFDLTGYTPTYWLINGKAYPDTMPGISAPPGSRLLLRYVNAGHDNTTMTLLGAHQHVLARDASMVPRPFDAVAETIPAGGTEDTLLTMPSTAPPASAGFPLYNRQLHLSNGPLTGATPDAGGMLTFIHP